ncbi:MAG TPA: cytochrome c3 family protein [Bryobacteraceae bacterium]|nr:cytochrome c3 family protein [Bryobacteraceae bacterium]
MICHQAVKQESPAIQRLAALAKDAAVPVAPLPYRIPDFVFFSHATHLAAKVKCESCHGEVWQVDLAKPAVPPKMMGCVNCHKASGAKMECTACHELSQ